MWYIFVLDQRSTVFTTRFPQYKQWSWPLAVLEPILLYLLNAYAMWTRNMEPSLTLNNDDGSAFNPYDDDSEDEPGLTYMQYYLQADQDDQVDIPMLQEEIERAIKEHQDKEIEEENAKPPGVIM